MSIPLSGIAERLEREGLLRGNVDTRAASVVVEEATADSRQVRPGTLYCAVRGSSGDGHDFLGAAQEAGAALVVFPRSISGLSPEREAARSETRRLMEAAIDELPEPFRLVFILREIEECTVEETAGQLDILPETVKTRLFRARKLLRQALCEKLASSVTEAFPFLGPRCQRITEAVLDRLEERSSTRAGDSPRSPGQARAATTMISTR